VSVAAASLGMICAYVLWESVGVGMRCVVASVCMGEDVGVVSMWCEHVCRCKQTHAWASGVCGV